MGRQSYSVLARHRIMGITQVTNITVYLCLKYVTGSGKANVDRDHHAVMATPMNWNVQLPYYSAYGEKKVNLTERMRRAKGEMAWSEGDDGGNKTCTEGYYTLPYPFVFILRGQCTGSPMADRA